MKIFKNVIVVLVMFLGISLFFALLANNASAQDLDFEIRETITIPTEHSGAYVRHVGDLDYDDNLDIVYAWGDPYSTYVIERDGDTFVPRSTLEGYCHIVAEVDGDNYPEILATIGRYTAKIFEATGDNTYAWRKTMNFSSKIEWRTRAGDSDGDGKGEFLIPAEWVGISIYEATSNDFYELEQTLYGTCPYGSSYGCGNGNIRSAGVYDLDGDGHPETVFTADPYNAYQRTLYVFTERNGTREQIYYSNVEQFASQSLGDLDGNGLGEIIGLTTYTKELIIYESQGTNDDFQIVYHVPRDPVYPYREDDVMDFDEDGQSELWRPIDDSNSGQLDVFTLAHRDGGTIIDFYNSGEFLQSFSGDIRGLLAIGDTNGDGRFELAVVQGDNIHILEQKTNQPPSVTVNQNPVTVDEGQTATNTGSVSDPDQDDVTLSTSIGTVINNGDGTWSWSFATNDGPAESQTVTITADDGNGGTSMVTFDLTVNNVSPTIDAVAVPIDPVLLNTPVYATADFSDPAGVKDETYTCTVNYGDGGCDEWGTVDGFTCAGSGHPYASPGVYTVSVTVTDKDEGSGSRTASEYIVIYDPEGGFVTGGGWIDSPPGAYTGDLSLTGKANFGFVSKYKKGATTPTGETEFQFKVADLNFHSDSYDWLVIAGHKAKYKGTGTINGAGNYGFMLSAIDEKLTQSTDVDLFRIKIWDKDSGDAIVYDNQVEAADDADPTTAIGGGSIVIHQAK